MKLLARSVILIALLITLQTLPALHFARWNTSLGSFTAEIYDDQTPITGNNFIDLTNSGFYNNLIFHRVIAGFVIQDGCPNGNGTGGPGYTIPLEIYPGFHHDQAGILAMARASAPNTAGSQYYFALAPQPHLDGNYAIFGKVVQGLDTVLAIGSVPTDANNRPLTPVTIDTLRMLDLSISSTTPPDTSTVYCSLNETQMFIVEAYALHSALNYTWYVDEVLQSGSGSFIFETAFNTAGTHTVRCTVSSQDWSYDISWDIFAGNVAVDETVPPVITELKIAPNPSHKGFSIKLSEAQVERYKLSVYDLKGRLIRRDVEQAKRSNEWFWDGLNAEGKRAAAGMYIINARSSKRSLWQKCLVY